MRSTIYLLDEESLVELYELITDHFFQGVLEPRTFTSTARGLDAFRAARTKPRIVCASLMRMGGLELAYQVKSLAPETRFLLTTGCPAAVVNEALRCADVLPDAVLLKPFAVEAFVSIVEALRTGIPVPLGECSSGVWPFRGTRKSCNARRRPV